MVQIQATFGNGRGWRGSQMVAYASYRAQKFLETPDDIIFARLVQSDAVSGFSQFSHKQGWSWGEAIRLMKSACEKLIAAGDRYSGVGVVLEYRIPRREKRLDAAFLFCNTVAVIEFKAGSASATSQSIAQVSDYCLDLAHYPAQTQGSSAQLRHNRVIRCPHPAIL